MKRPDNPELRDEAIALVRRFSEVEAIGRGGSQSTGTADCLSDMDLMVLCGNHFPTFQARREIYASVAGLEPPHHGHVVSSGYDQPPLSVRFEVDTLRLHGVPCDVLWTTQEGWKAILDAVIDRIDAPEFLVAGLCNVAPLFDPEGSIEDLKRSIPEYPEQRALRKAGHYMFPAHFWLSRIGSLQKAVFRNDVIEYHKREGEMVESLIGALFAVNRTWHLHSRGLNRTTANFDLMPDRFVVRIEAMISRQGQFRSLAACHAELKTLFRELATQANGRFRGWNLPVDWPDREEDVQQ